MVELLQSKRDLIAAACARHSVVRLEAFGSALRDDFVPGKAMSISWWSSSPWNPTRWSMPTSA